LERKNWQAVTVLMAKQRRERQIRGYFAETFSRKEERHEYDTRIKNGLVHLHRQMDTQGFVFAKRQALSPWAVAPPARKRVAAHADQNSPQSRIRRFNRQAMTLSKAITVEYSLTKLGRTIIAPIGGMCRWAKRYCKDVSADVRLRKAETR
jgi:hypothetical protein